MRKAKGHAISKKKRKLMGHKITFTKISDYSPNTCHQVCATVRHKGVGKANHVVETKRERSYTSKSAVVAKLQGIRAVVLVI